MIKLNLHQIKFAAEECARQQSGELSVADMCRAVAYAQTQTIFTKEFILLLGQFVDPKNNSNGFRRVPVYFANFTFAVDASVIESRIDRLIENWNNMSAEEVYHDFEETHPFIDGNGRVGAILYNFKLRTLNNPVTAPEYKK